MLDSTDHTHSKPALGFTITIIFTYSFYTQIKTSVTTERQPVPQMRSTLYDLRIPSRK